MNIRIVTLWSTYSCLSNPLLLMELTIPVETIRRRAVPDAGVRVHVHEAPTLDTLHMAVEERDIHNAVMRAHGIEPAHSIAAEIADVDRRGKVGPALRSRPGD